MRNVSILAVLAALVAAGMPRAAAEDDRATKLAAVTFPGGWKATGAVVAYDAKNLFELIDGEAELYFPYGFKQTLTVTYASASSLGEKIEAEVYELGTPLDAFGAYSNYRDLRSKLEPIGTEGFIGTTQAVCFQDRFFVKIRLTGKLLGNRDVLMACAKAVLRTLPPNRLMPEEPGLLKVEDVVPQTVRYIAQSMLGYDFFTMGLTADATVATKPCTVFAVIGMNPKDAEDTLNRFVAHLEQTKGRYRWEETPGGKVLLAVDPLQKGVVATCVGSYVVGVAKLSTPKEGLPMLAQLRAVAAKHK